MKFFAVVLLLIVTSCVVSAGLSNSPSKSAKSSDPFEGLRGACKIFLERQIMGGDFGSFSSWTVIANNDGTHSVGAKYLRASGQQEYTTCILRREGEDISLVRLSRLQ